MGKLIVFQGGRDDAPKDHEALKEAFNEALVEMPPTVKDVLILAQGEDGTFMTYSNNITFANALFLLEMTKADILKQA